MGIYGVAVFRNTVYGVTIYGIMQCLQTIYCRFVKLYAEKYGKTIFEGFPFVGRKEIVYFTLVDSQINYTKHDENFDDNNNCNRNRHSSLVFR